MPERRLRFLRGSFGPVAAMAFVALLPGAADLGWYPFENGELWRVGMWLRDGTSPPMSGPLTGGIGETGPWLAWLLGPWLAVVPPPWALVAAATTSFIAGMLLLVPFVARPLWLAVAVLDPCTVISALSGVDVNHAVPWLVLAALASRTDLRALVGWRALALGVVVGIGMQSYLGYLPWLAGAAAAAFFLRAPAGRTAHARRMGVLATVAAGALLVWLPRVIGGEQPLWSWRLGAVGLTGDGWGDRALRVLHAAATNDTAFWSLVPGAITLPILIVGVADWLPRLLRGERGTRRAAWPVALGALCAMVILGLRTDYTNWGHASGGRVLALIAFAGWRDDDGNGKRPRRLLGAVAPLLALAILTWNWVQWATSHVPGRLAVPGAWTNAFAAVAADRDLPSAATRRAVAAELAARPEPASTAWALGRDAAALAEVAWPDAPVVASAPTVRDVYEPEPLWPGAQQVAGTWLHRVAVTPPTTTVVIQSERPATVMLGMGGAHVPIIHCAAPQCRALFDAFAIPRNFAFGEVPRPPQPAATTACALQAFPSHVRSIERCALTLREGQSLATATAFTAPPGQRHWQWSYVLLYAVPPSVADRGKIEGAGGQNRLGGQP